MIECQLYFWILKSYQHGTRIGGERDSSGKYITGWTKKSAANIGMRLHSSMCVCLRLRASASAHRKLNVWTRLDTKKFLRPDVSFVQGLSGCTIGLYFFIQKNVHGSYIDCLSNYRLRACGPNVLCHIQFFIMIDYTKSCILLRNCVHLKVVLGILFDAHLYTVFTRSDAAATIYFITQFCAVSMREWLLIESGVY